MTRGEVEGDCAIAAGKRVTPRVRTPNQKARDNMESKDRQRNKFVIEALRRRCLHRAADRRACFPGELRRMCRFTRRYQVLGIRLLTVSISLVASSLVVEWVEVEVQEGPHAFKGALTMVDRVLEYSQKVKLERHMVQQFLRY